MELWMSQLGNPTLLFFILGFIAILVKSDLEIPAPIAKFLSLYLLLAIGFKGGQELTIHPIHNEHIWALILGLGSSIFVPVVAFIILKKRFGHFNAGAIAASYGSVSAVTFVAASNFLEAKHMAFDGVMVAVMAAMEAPAIIVGVLLIQLSSAKESSQKIKHLIHHALTNGSVMILAGSFLIGCLTDIKQAEGIKPFTSDLFKGFLALFLLEMGMVTAKKLRGFKTHGMGATAFAIVFPLLCGATMALLSGYFIQNIANQFILSVLAASASYIAVPAAMTKAVPEADEGLYIPMAIGITFPMNLILGMPIYFALINK